MPWAFSARLHQRSSQEDPFFGHCHSLAGGAVDHSTTDRHSPACGGFADGPRFWVCAQLRIAPCSGAQAGRHWNRPPRRSLIRLRLPNAGAPGVCSKASQPLASLDSATHFLPSLKLRVYNSLLRMVQIYY